MKYNLTLKELDEETGIIKPYFKKLANLSEVIRLSLADAKSAAERDKFVSKQNYFFENEFNW